MVILTMDSCAWVSRIKILVIGWINGSGCYELYQRP